VESGLIEGIAVTHGAVIHEELYTPGSYQVHHPIRVVVRMARTSGEFSHLLFVGLTNTARTAACHLGAVEATYGGEDGGDPGKRSFIGDFVVPPECAEGALAGVPLQLWVGANPLLAAEEDVARIVTSGNVQVFGPGGADLSGQSRNESCRELKFQPQSKAYEPGESPCSWSLTVGASGGDNLQLRRFQPGSSVAILHAAQPEEDTCKPTKGRPFLESSLQVWAFGKGGTADDGSEVNALAGRSAEVRYRICKAASGPGGGPPECAVPSSWRPLLVNPEGDDEQGPWDAGLADKMFGGQPGKPPPPPKPTPGIEDGAQRDVLSELPYGAAHVVNDELFLRREDCAHLRDVLGPGTYVVEACVVGSDPSLEQGLGGPSDNCQRQLVEVNVALPSTEATFASFGGSKSSTAGDKDTVESAISLVNTVAVTTQKTVGDVRAYARVAGGWFNTDLFDFDFDIKGDAIEPTKSYLSGKVQVFAVHLYPQTTKTFDVVAMPAEASTVAINVSLLPESSKKNSKKFGLMGVTFELALEVGSSGAFDMNLVGSLRQGTSGTVQEREISLAIGPSLGISYGLTATVSTGTVSKGIGAVGYLNVVELSGAGLASISANYAFDSATSKLNLGAIAALSLPITLKLGVGTIKGYVTVFGKKWYLTLCSFTGASWTWTPWSTSKVLASKEYTF
jgi:hypothetical protein